MAWNSYLRFSGYLPDREYLTQSGSRQVILLMLFLCYHVFFQFDFACACTSEKNLIHCYGYMVLPSLIITSLIMWHDRRIGRIFRFACYHSSSKKGRCRCRGKFCLECVLYLLQAATSAFLWCGSVLVDGDWYVCCGAGHSEDMWTLSCLKESEIGPTERTRKVNLKNTSMIIGLICILLTAVSSLVLVFPWSTWFTRRNYFRVAFEEAILEQTELIVWKEMDKAAAESVTKSLDSLSSSIPRTTGTTPSEPSITKSDPVEEQKTLEKEEIHLNINVNWEEIACLADVLIESIPNNFSNNKNINISINNNINGN